MNKHKKKTYLYLGIATGLVVLALLYFFTKPFSSKSTYHSSSQSAAQQTKSQQSGTQGQNTSPNQSSSPAPSSNSQSPTTQNGGQSTPPSENKSPSTPNGSPSNALTPSTDALVSSHHVQPTSYINSVCSTVSGATCTITFTSNGLTEHLPPQVTNINGSAYWNGWTPQEYGLTPGSWKITATATQNGQSSSASDAMLLQVL